MFSENLWSTLINNTAILLVLFVTFELFYSITQKRKIFSQIIKGLIISVICIVIMATPYEILPGVRFDARTILLSVTAFIFGVIPASIVAITAIIYRLILGGEGMLTGFALIITSVSIGIVWKYWIFPKHKKSKWISIYLMGIFVHITMLLCLLMLPARYHFDIMRMLSIPILLIFPIASLLLSMLILNQKEKREQQALLAQSEDKFRYMFENAVIAYTFTMPAGEIVNNVTLCKMLGYTKDELVGVTWQQITHPDDIEKSQKQIDLLASGKVSQIHFEKRYIKKNGEPILVDIYSSVRRDEMNRPLYFMTSIVDISEQRIVQDELIQSEEKYRSLVTQMSQGLALHEIILDDNGKPIDYRFLDANTSFENLTGLKRENIIGKTVLELLPKTEKYWIERYGKVALTGDPVRFENFSQELNKFFEVVAYALKDGQFATIFSDITNRKQTEQNLIFLNEHDDMTGLYNRRYFELVLTELEKDAPFPVSIVFGDINGVKVINDAFGHADGDRLIMDAAQILNSCCRKEDIVSRIGGDEFAIILKNTDHRTTQEIVRSIVKSCGEYNAKRKSEVNYINISLGYDTMTSPDESIYEVLKNAEDYMYRRKLLEHLSSHSALIAAIRATLLEKNHETEEHSERLIGFAKSLGGAMQLSQKELDELELLASLHDIGKVGIPEHILQKPGPLDAKEWFEIKKHPEIGYRIAMATPELMPIARYILCHQERWDGKGYPNHLEGENIPLLSRIISVVDAYDAMTQDRPYRKGIGKEAALQELITNAGTQFDPHLVDVFITQVLGEKK